MKSLLKQITDKVNEYGDKAVIDLIDECMANNWKGIIWEKIKKEDKLPSWWDKDFKEKVRTEDEEQQLQELIRGNKR